MLVNQVKAYLHPKVYLTDKIIQCRAISGEKESTLTELAPLFQQISEE